MSYWRDGSAVLVVISREIIDSYGIASDAQAASEITFWGIHSSVLPKGSELMLVSTSTFLSNGRTGSE